MTNPDPLSHLTRQIIKTDHGLYIDSRDLAKNYGRLHKDVLRRIREMHIYPRLQATDIITRTNPAYQGAAYYHISVPVFCLLHLNGAHAARQREAYFHALLRCDAAALGQDNPPINSDYLNYDAARIWAETPAASDRGWIFDSRDIARHFQINHENLIRRFQNLRCRPAFSRAHFHRITNSTGQYYHISRIGFLWLLPMWRSVCAPDIAAAYMSLIFPDFRPRPKPRTAPSQKNEQIIPETHPPEQTDTPDINPADLVAELRCARGQIWADSRDIARHFDKRHDNILQSIQNLDCPGEFTDLNFQVNEFTDSIGRKLPRYDISADGFTFLVMGFTGRRAAAFKLAYIAAFNQLRTIPRQIPENPQNTGHTGGDLITALADIRTDIADLRRDLTRTQILSDTLSDPAIRAAAPALRQLLDLIPPP